MEEFTMTKKKIGKELKSESILIRVTERQKKNMVEKAKNAGLTLTAYIEECSTKVAIISLIEAQKIVKELHELNLNLKKCNKNEVDVEKIQNIYSKKVLEFQALAKRGGI